MSRYESEKRRYQPTARRITSGSNCRHLNRPQTEDARRSILPAYHGVTAKLQHFHLLEDIETGDTETLDYRIEDLQPWQEWLMLHRFDRRR